MEYRAVCFVREDRMKSALDFSNFIFFFIYSRYFQDIGCAELDVVLGLFTPLSFFLQKKLVSTYHPMSDKT
jgi:hypothetical protein